MVQSTKLTPPSKPYSAFPLTAHPSGKYCKRINHKTYYFGQWARKQGGKLVRVPGDGWQDALAAYKRVADDLHAGRTPTPEGLTIGQLVERFLQLKTKQLKSGELTEPTLTNYERICQRMVEIFGERSVVTGLKPVDFEHLRDELAKTWGPATLQMGINNIKTVFKYAYDAELIDKPIRYGPGFKSPSAATLRKHKSNGGKKLFTRDEIHTVLASTGRTLRAFVLLGINCGLNNSDCARLEFKHLDLENGWLTFPRPKTGCDRRAKLWPETIEAIQLVQRARPNAQKRNDARLVFLTNEGRPFDPKNISGQISRILKKHEINGRRCLNFTALRHTFRTVADGSKDFPAVRLAMGHIDSSIDAVYREEISDERLADVAEFVRNWLFGEKDAQPNE